MKTIKSIIEDCRIWGGDEYDDEKLEQEIKKYIIRILKKVKYDCIVIDREIKKLKESK